MIASTRIIESTIQAEGTQRVQVAFTDHLEYEHRRQYDFFWDVDVNEKIKIRKSHVEQGLKDQDIELAVGKVESGVVFELLYAVRGELVSELQKKKNERDKEINDATSKRNNINTELEMP